YERQREKYSGTYTSRVMDAFSTGQSWTSMSWVPTLPFFKELPDESGGAIQNETSTDYSSLVGSTGSSGADDLMSGIVGLWHLNGTFGTIADGASVPDTSGQGNNGSVFDSAASNTIQYMSGVFREGIRFDGVNDGIAIPDDNSLDLTTNATFSAWFYADGLSTAPNSMTILGKDRNDYGAPTYGW